MRIAVSGKGGTGKTTVAGLLSRHYGRAFCIQHSLNLIVTLPFDEGLLAAEANGTAIIDAYPDSPLVQATATLATTLEETLNGNRR